MVFSASEINFLFFSPPSPQQKSIITDKLCLISGKVIGQNLGDEGLRDSIKGSFVTYCVIKNLAMQREV